MNALHALNHIENGGAVLVSLPGCLSSVFRLDGYNIISENSEIGVCGGHTPAGTLQHFQNILRAGGTLSAADL